MNPEYTPPPTLHLTLKRHWFDMIESGEKKEEYREVKPYWDTRLTKQYDRICFRNGYHPASPMMIVECLGQEKGFGIPRWGAPNGEVWILKLGMIIFTYHCTK
jgi:hypothetical protein